MMKFSHLMILINAFIVTSAFTPTTFPSIDFEAKLNILHHTHYQQYSTSTCLSKTVSPRSASFRGVALKAVADKFESKSSSSSESQENDDDKVTGRKGIFSWGADRIPILSRRTKSKDTGDMNNSSSSSAHTVEEETKVLPPPNALIQHIESLEQYKVGVADEKDKIVVVRFYAEWCKACQAVKPAFTRLAKRYTSQNKDRDQRGAPLIKFVEVPLTKENTVLHQGLGVPSLPYGHVYHPGVGLVEERKIAKSKFKVFEQVLQSYAEGQCECGYLETDEGEIQIVQANPQKLMQ